MRSRTRAPRASIAGSIAEALLRIDGVVITADDLRDYQARWRDPALVPWNGRRVATRGGLSGVPELLPRLPRLSGLGEIERVVALVEALETAERGGEHTTNMVAVDGHGRACVLTHSLGVGAGVWVPGLDLQLNNLLGETDIAFGDPQPGDHLESRMAPSLAFDDVGSRARDRRGRRDAAANRPLHRPRRDPRRGPRARGRRRRGHASTPLPELVDAEPGVDEHALEELEARGRTIRRWERVHHYFGGVSCVGRTGAAGDPRRSGAAFVF